MTRKSRKQAGKRFFDYCIEHNIPLKLGIDDGTPYYYFSKYSENAPDCFVEVIAEFRFSEIFLKVYYTALGTMIVKESEHKDELLRVLNYLNASMLHESNILDRILVHNISYMPKIAMTENCDIVVSSIIPYDFYELEPEKTALYITEFCPELLNAIAVDFFLTAFGKQTADRAISNLYRELFGTSTEE